MTNVYLFRDNYYCSGCITWILDETNDFREYGEVVSHGYHWQSVTDDTRAIAEMRSDYDDKAEDDLDGAAAYYDINRDAAHSGDFPRLLRDKPWPPGFCAECLQWFDAPYSVDAALRNNTA